MKNAAQFFDELQRRIDSIYATKFYLDEQSRSGKPRANGDLDKQSLFLQLAEEHDYIRNIPFSQILLKSFVGDVHIVNNHDTRRPLYNQFTLLFHAAEFDLTDYLAQHLTMNVSHPVIINGDHGAPMQLNHSAVTKQADLNSVFKDVKENFKLYPYIAFLYSISLCETKLPTKGKGNVAT